MLKLQWLQINRFRSVKPGTRLTFNPGYNVLLGQNGTGKTTLLNLVAAVFRTDFSEFRENDFDLQYSLLSDLGSATLSVRNEHRMPAPQHESDLMQPPGGRRGAIHGIDLNRPEPVLTVQAKLESQSFGTAVMEIQGSSGTVRVMDSATLGPPLNFEAEITHDLFRVIAFALIDLEDKYPSLWQLVNLIAEVGTRRFDESLDYFTQLSSSEVNLSRAPDVIRAYSDKPVPPELEDALTTAARKQWGLSRYVIAHDQLPFLQEVVRLLDFESAEAIIDLQESARAESGDKMSLSSLGFFFAHRGGWKISAKLLSYGQKRMLAFLYYLATMASVAVADELVNGLHHRWIRAAIEALGQRQVFLTSQNPLLLDYLTFETPEQVRSTFILCRWEGEGAQAKMVWENMTQEAAEDFFDSYKVGFQQVGELLQAKGLW